MLVAASNNAFAINGFTGMKPAQIVSFFIVFVIFNTYVFLEAVALAAFYVTARPRHGRVRTAAIWHFVAGCLIMVAFISTVWGAPAERAFVDPTGRHLTLDQAPNITVFGLGLGRAGMLFVGMFIAALGVLCLLIGFASGVRQKRDIREAVYAPA